MDEVDEQSFKNLFYQYYPELFSFAYSLLGDRTSARRGTTGVFLLLWKKRGHFNNEKDTRAFLYSTIRNNCLNYLKFKQKNPDVKEYFPEMERDDTFPADVWQELSDFVASIS
ncbi:MAG TPA: sigma factor [Puia sp.]|nr:sigma factor [Puia sp.]